jgi:hypothetical protein
MYIPSISGLVHWYSFLLILPEKRFHHLMYAVQCGIYDDKRKRRKRRKRKSIMM